VQRVLGITDANHIVLVDDCAAGAAAAANAGARSIALLVAGTPAPKSDATIACLSEIA
jgi:beta-phosphoglucomutase-like phosphatase (HAD superfamily)